MHRLRLRGNGDRAIPVKAHAKAVYLPKASVCLLEASTRARWIRPARARRTFFASLVWRPARDGVWPMTSPTLLDRRRCWQPTLGWPCSARAGSFRGQKVRALWRCFVATCDKLRNRLRKAGRRSCPCPSFPAHRLSLQQRAPRNRSRAARSAFYDATLKVTRSSPTATLFVGRHRQLPILDRLFCMRVLREGEVAIREAHTHH